MQGIQDVQELWNLKGMTLSVELPDFPGFQIIDICYLTSFQQL